jgi:hypothetical protein
MGWCCDGSDTPTGVRAINFGADCGQSATTLIGGQALP